MEVVNLPGLVQEVRRRAGDAPLDRLEAALALNEELASAADELIGHFVTEARQAGCSWTQIGERMGVSKQAARQRFTVLPGPARLGSPEQQPRAGGLPWRPPPVRRPPTAPRRSARTISFSGCTRRAWPRTILEKLGIRADEVRRTARDMFPGWGQPDGHLPPESAEARHAVEGAAALARRGLRGNHVGPAHLLGALALDQGSRARRVLGQLDASIPVIKRELECYLSPGKQRRRGSRAAGQQCSFCGWAAPGRSQRIARPGRVDCAGCVKLAGEVLAERAGT